MNMLASGGFASLLEYCLAVRTADHEGIRDPRLVATSTRAPTGASEVDPTAGGFIVPAQFADRFFGSLYDDSVIAPLTQIEELTGPLLDFSIPGADEISRADGSRWGGAQSFWAPEAAIVSSTKPKTRRISFGAKKLTAVVYTTNELLADGGLFEAFVKKAFAAEIGFKLDTAIYSGTGAGTPMGILAANSLIVVPKEAGQAPGTVVQLNISNMWKRLPLASRQRAVWLCNEDAESTFGTLNVGDRPHIYKPAGEHGPYPTLYGRPVIAIEQAPSLGTQGDIVLADLSQYMTITGAPRYALSADAGFLADESLIRFTLRCDGNPMWSSPITPYNGTLTRSPFITLGAR